MVDSLSKIIGYPYRVRALKGFDPNYTSLKTVETANGTHNLGKVYTGGSTSTYNVWASVKTVNAKGFLYILWPGLETNANAANVQMRILIDGTEVWLSETDAITTTITASFVNVIAVIGSRTGASPDYGWNCDYVPFYESWEVQMKKTENIAATITGACVAYWIEI